MIKLFTFCVDIGRHTRVDLIKCLQILITSIEKHNEYLLICYSNFDIPIKSKNVQFRSYYDNSTKIYNVNKYHNLSRNKIFVFKDLYDEFKEYFTWIDIDTIVATDLSYLNNYNNFFITIGGPCIERDYRTQLFKGNNKYNTPYCDYIQGNIWKINLQIYNDIIALEKKLIGDNLIPTYDLQCLFNYYAYYEHKENELILLGKNHNIEHIYGTSVWDTQGITFATQNGINNLLYSDNKLYTNLHPGKEIHFVSFTFYSLQKVWNSKKFIQLFK